MVKSLRFPKRFDGFAVLIPSERETWYTKVIRGIRSLPGASQTSRVKQLRLAAFPYWLTSSPRHFHRKIVRPFECLFPRSRAMTRFHRSAASRCARLSARLVLRTLFRRLTRIEDRVLAYCARRQIRRGPDRMLALVPSGSMLPRIATLASADRSQRGSARRKLAARTLGIVIAMAILLGSGGMQVGHAQIIFDSAAGTYEIPQWAWKIITNNCGEPPAGPKTDPFWRGCYFEELRILGLGGGPAGASSARLIHPAAGGVAQASGTFSLALNSGTPYLPFLGNQLVEVSWVPNATAIANVTAVYATALRRQSDCSLDEDFVLPTATTPSTAAIASVTGAQDYLHQLSGLTTKPDVFANGCDYQVLGLPATGNILLLGETADGAAISAQLASSGLYVTITDPAANTSKSTQLTSSQNGGGSFLARASGTTESSTLWRRH